MIQKDIVSACKIEAVKAILEELNGDYFALLVDESFDVSRKEQMTIVFRYIDRMGFVMEQLIDIVHVENTSASSLKDAIFNLLVQHSLSPSSVRGQCYDGANNMQGEINGLKMLIRRESKSAHSIHCFAHQLQLPLVGVSKKCVEVGKLVVLISNILNVLGSSFKRMDNLRNSQKSTIQVALDMGELTTGRGLNQQLGLSRACDTRWGSHYKSFNNFIIVFGSILEVLESLALDARSMDERAKAMEHLEACQTFEIAFMLHLMRDQDIANAMLLVEVAKRRLQNQLASYIIDVCDVDERFSNLNGLCDLSKRLVQTKKHSNYPLVFHLLKLALLLPVATASVERAFSAMKFIKNDLWS
ncbi:hypothetical protein R3W88_020010 [Solanum pinnatisectum]|uniref:Zinc finger MYM-type protein 1-like n=1 Tax=Solanum pinnatisectum TaxID=50273 RepID=A0AAV9KME3_9SOLN|nr:hypothetical protein R3W88_020010 [Solanum pinnatisectum]